MRLLVLFALLSASSAANILALLPMATPSHSLFVRPLLHTLAARGHHITVLSPYSTNNPNITDIILEGAQEKYHHTIKYRTLIKSNWVSSLWSNKQAISYVHEMDAFEMASKGSRLLMNSTEHFDLIFIDFALQECFLGFVHKFRYPPVIGLVPYVTMPWASEVLGYVENPAYMPHPMLPATDKMGFWTRLLNTVLHAYAYYEFHYVLLPAMDRLSKKHFGDETPGLSDIGKNFSLVFVNSVDGLDYPRGTIAQMIPVGGMHFLPPKQLPQFYQELLDGATAGAIFFSLGSVTRVSDMPVGFVDEMMSAFRRLPQRVLWKWDGEDISATQLAPNVWRAPWMPQADILDHPNIICFLTHGGLNSIHEATAKGVPMVIMAVTGDHQYHAEKAVDRGLGVKLSVAHVTADLVVEAVLKVTQDPSYRASAVRLSGIMSDAMLPPLDRAVYWTEYVLRHKGASHLRSQAADMTWYQLHLLDVAAMLLAIMTAMFLAVRMIIRRIAAGLKYKID